MSFSVGGGTGGGGSVCRGLILNLNKNRRGSESLQGCGSGAKQVLIQGSSHHQQQLPIKIAAINGKPRVQRYLSRECEFAGCILPLVKGVERTILTRCMLAWLLSTTIVVHQRLEYRF